jgi:hypothetical protein
MKYILMMNATKADCKALEGWPKKDFQAHCAYLIALQKELKQPGELVSTEGMAFPDQARLVRAAKMARRSRMASFRKAKNFWPAFRSSMFQVQSEPMPLPHECRQRRGRAACRSTC